MQPNLKEQRIDTFIKNIRSICIFYTIIVVKLCNLFESIKNWVSAWNGSEAN